MTKARDLARTRSDRGSGGGLSSVEDGNGMSVRAIVRRQQTVADRPPPRSRSRPGYRFLAIIGISHFPLLRRTIGAERAELVAREIGDQARHVLDGHSIAVIGRDRVEVSGWLSDPGETHIVLDQLRQRLILPLVLAGELRTVPVRIGAAVLRTEQFDPVRIAEFAEQALEQAPEGGVSARVMVNGATEDPLALLHDLSDAVARGEMFLQFQPKVRIRSQQVVAAEALIRWRHPTRGLILPGDFIPLAEQAGQITPLTLWTIEQAIADQQQLARQGFDIPVFVNVSGTLLGERRFVDQVRALIARSNAKLGFEITETAVIRDPDTAIAHLKMFADQGIALAIDDYGAGLSSLAYLKRLPANELKIDKMFVTHLTSSNRDPLIVRSTIDLAHALEMDVTAEGVETSAALALLTVMGCDMVQGFLLGRPIELEAFSTYLRQNQHLGPIQRPRPSFRRKAGGS